MLNTDVPYLPPAGLLEPKPEPVEELHGDYCFMYKEEGNFVQGNGSKPSFIAGPGFEAYLRRLAKDIFDIVHCSVGVNGRRPYVILMFFFVGRRWLRNCVKTDVKFWVKTWSVVIVM